jgi:predicted PurR-regulated permease PerM
MSATPVTDAPPQRDLARITLAVLVIGLLMIASLWVLEPFLAAGVWAAMIVVATWPLMLAVEARVGGRRWLAVAVMTLAILLVLVMPLVLAVTTIAQHAEDIAGWVRDTASAGLPSPPGWVHEIPLVGPKIAEEWTRLAASSREELTEQAAPYARKAIQWFVEQAGGAGRMLMHLVLTLVIAVILYTTGEKAASGVRRFARRLAGERGESSVVLAGQAVRAVALGVVVTAIAQSAAAGLGLVVCGIPYALLLTAVIFMLCIAQLGPILVLAAAVGWLYWTGSPVWATVLLVWTIVVGTLDNVLRPYLIKRGADLPLLLIFAGVIGGLISFGIIGLFIGPVVLAVTYRLLEAWISDIDRGASAAPAAPSAPAQDPGAPATPTGVA